ncbi:membrane or secreted protein [Flavobacteriaceae bacterium Ap0902]|nr:membrane or secreted protein [Flavobacteriaceae bacterium Ap0902]
MELLLITIGLLLIAFAGIAIKIWAKKDGKFAGTCASQNPYLNKTGEACGYCGKMPENCDNKDTKLESA